MDKIEKVKQITTKFLKDFDNEAHEYPIDILAKEIVDALYTERAGETCPECSGFGEVSVAGCSGTSNVKCPVCRGTGKVSQPVSPVEPDLMLTEIIPTREPFPHTISQAYANGWTDCRHLVIRKVQPLLTANEAKIRELSEEIGQLKTELYRLWNWGNSYCTEHLEVPMPKEMGGGIVAKQRRLRRRCRECWDTLLGAYEPDIETEAAKLELQQLKSEGKGK